MGEFYHQGACNRMYVKILLTHRENVRIKQGNEMNRQDIIQRVVI